MIIYWVSKVNKQWKTTPLTVTPPTKTLTKVSGGSRNLKTGGGAVKGRGSGGRLEAPSGSRAKPWWGSGGRSPRKLLKSRYFERQNHVVWRANFYLFSRHFSH